MYRLSRRDFLSGIAVTASCAAVLRPFEMVAQMEPPAQPILFPEHFYWGAATAAMQIENSPAYEGGGMSLWEPFIVQNPKVMKDSSSPKVTCDETHHWREDIALMQQIDLNSYRFSISWPRLLPEGKGRVNQRGIDFYDRFIDGLLAANIKPLVTCFHFDYPDALQQQGGWTVGDSPKWFSDYSHLLATRYSDRVEEWLTINEPNIALGLGCEVGIMPPARQLSEPELAQQLHHMLLGHGMSVQAIRAGAKRPVKVALPVAGMIRIPASNAAGDIEAARVASFTPRRVVLIPGVPPSPMLNNALWLDPIFKGMYPEPAFELYPTLRQIAKPDDLKVISTAVDRCAVNLYFGMRARAGADGQPEIVPASPDAQRTHYDWEVTPEIMYWAPKYLYERYGKPILITENGMSWADKPGPDGRVHDPQRIAFMNAYLNGLRRAIHAGVPIDGYMHWSLIDNWEFTSGFTEQFGLVYVDHLSQKRILKDSGLYYREIIQSRGAALM